MSNPLAHAAIAVELERIARMASGAVGEAQENLMHGATRREVMATMAQALDQASDELLALQAHVEASAPPEPAGRPLEAIFADIRTEGHACITVFVNVYNGKPYARCSSHLPEPERGDPAGISLSYEEWATKVEMGEATVESDDLAAAAETRLAQIRELNAARTFSVEVTAWPGVAGQVTGSGYDITGPEEVDSEHDTLAAEEARRTAAASEEGA